jgi:ribonuclease P protein component
LTAVLQQGWQDVRATQRLRNSHEFRRVREQGRCWSDSRLVLCVHPNELATVRCGYAVSKHIGNAVRRNRIKRLMRESVRTYGDLLLSGWDIVIIARPRVSGASYWDVQSSVGHLLQQAGVLGSGESALPHRAG